MALIELRNVNKSFDRLVVLRDFSLKIEEGKSLVIIGASGTGKSVLLKHIVGLLQPDSGEVYFDGKRIDGLTERELVPIRQQFGFLFQMSALFDSQTVADNIAFPLREHTNKPADEIARIVRDKLNLVGLPDVGKKMPAQLSGGQRKRVALARAIAMGPRVLLYDEPTTGLDPIRSDVINELILKLQQSLRVTSITVTHDMQSAFKIADRIVMIDEGRIVFDGTPKQVQEETNPVVRRFVEGDASDEELAAIRNH